MNYNDLKVGQIWAPCDECDYILEIVGLTKKEAEFRQLETGEIYFQELTGPNGFSDFLEENNYELKV